MFVTAERTRLEELEFSLQRVINLLEHAEPMMALEVARKALGIET